MTQSEIRVGWEDLKAFTREVFVRLGMPPQDAETEAEVLVWANLRGVDSHGVLLVHRYVDWVDQGFVNVTPNIKVVKETPSILIMEGDRAFGPVVTTQAMRRTIEKARVTGIGWCLIRDTMHQGAMAYYSLMAAEQDMAGIAIVCGSPLMAVHGARAAGVHNSPISIAVPGDRRGPLVLDMATSVAAGGKIALAKDKGIAIPPGWALDADGNPTTDPSQYAIVLPAAGPKGSGLAMMFECLSSVMLANPLLSPVLAGEQVDNRSRQNSIVAAIDIATFTDPGGYGRDVDALVDGVKALPKAEGVDEIFVPGEPEERVRQERTRNGVPLPHGTVASLRTVAERFGVAMPAGL